MAYTCDEMLDLAWDAMGEGQPYETFAGVDEAREIEEPESDIEDEGNWVPSCDGVKLIMDNALTVGEMCDLLKAHRMQCAVCLCERKDVQSDRLVLGTKDSVCCGEVA